MAPNEPLMLVLAMCKARTLLGSFKFTAEPERAALLLRTSVRNTDGVLALRAVQTDTAARIYCTSQQTINVYIMPDCLRVAQQV